jgi:uncharacterized membrane protein
MDRLSLLLSFAMVWLALSYVLFTGQQYFSAITLVIVFLLAISSAIVFVSCYKYSSSGSLASNVKADRIILIFLVAISVLAVAVASFDSANPSIYRSVPVIFMLVFGGVGISIAGLYLTMRLTKNMKSYALWIAVIVCAAVIACGTYAFMYSFRSVNWNGIDELAYNYYASYLFVHGTNPYLASMQPILQQRNIFPTVQLNGTFEYKYDYPAFSFLPYVFMPLFNMSNFFTFILIVTFLTVFVAYFIYYKSGFNKLVLIPIGVWFFITYTLVGTSNQYLAVSVLFLIAYVERRRFLLSGVLLGLSASIIQLVWFAIPFFYILVYRESGSRGLFKCVGATLILALVVNSYFILVSPSAFISNSFAIFGLNKLVFFGPNIVQFILAYYPVASWYSAVISITTLLALFVLFYLYTDTLRPLIAVGPIMIFFLAWRNISIYGLPFIPVIIAIYYVGEKDRVTDILKSKKPIFYSFAAMAVVFVLIAILIHGPYLNRNLLQIGNITPIIYGQQGPVANGRPTITGPYGLGGIKIYVSNNAGFAQPVSFYVISRNPNGNNYLLGSLLNVTLQGHSSYNYTLQYQLPLVNSSTKLYIFAFSQYYITSKRYQLNLAN